MSQNMSQEVEKLQLQVQQLQEEVQLLQRQRDVCNQNLDLQLEGPVREAMAYLCGRAAGRGREVLLAGLVEEVEEMEDDLKLQNQMSGISLRSCSRKKLQSSGPELVQVCVSGSCSDLNFQLEFLLSQVSQVSEGRSREASVSRLNVVLDSDDLQNFCSFLSRVEENNDLQLFCRTLRSFSDRCDDRARTFRHFQEKFPSLVSVPGGSRSEVMSVSHPQSPRCVLLLHWSVQVSDGGAVTPSMHLETRIPEEARRRFSSLSVSGAADAFQSLLGILGVEAAMESVIRAVGLLDV
ncbi:centromere protein P [Cololabis saira]|uniref:centromere protein P n=1 Tax=Cololabis saira TaxID=129043 RepID=UPI002AD1E8C0|nr:centromere protein P [Cololabis saira]